MKILVVDDQEDVREMLRLTLMFQSFQVSEAASGAEALSVLEGAELPDLVVLDVQMPVMDGYEVLARLREHRRTGELPVIVCSVKSSLTDAERAWKLGCDGYVKKPFVQATFLEEVRRVAASTTVERLAFRDRSLAEIEGALADPGASARA